MSREHATIRDSPGQLPHEHVVVDAVEELLQVDVYHPAAARLDIALRLTHRLVCAASRSEAVAVLREAGGE